MSGIRKGCEARFPSESLPSPGFVSLENYFPSFWLTEHASCFLLVQSASNRCLSCRSLPHLGALAGPPEHVLSSARLLLLMLFLGVASFSAPGPLHVLFPLPGKPLVLLHLDDPLTPERSSGISADTETLPHQPGPLSCAPLPRPVFGHWDCPAPPPGPWSISGAALVNEGCTRRVSGESASPRAVAVAVLLPRHRSFMCPGNKQHSILPKK